MSIRPNRSPAKLSSLLVAPALLAVMATPQTLFAAGGQGIWTDVADSAIPVKGQRLIVPQKYRTVALDWAALEAVLKSAPMEDSANAIVLKTVLQLPLPDGGFGRFHIEESPIMAPELAARFPEIRTYHGQGLDDPTAVVRFDRTPAGFHAMILSVSGTIYIDPFSRVDIDHHVSYFTRDYTSEAAAEWRCGVTGGRERATPPRGRARGATQPSGATLRTYRTVVAATGEYTAFHSAGAPTVAEGQAAIVTAMNRVNTIYENDVAIRMTLVANNDSVVYTDGATDPYTNNNGGTMLGQNQTNLDNVIGSANYDIGHVFSTGGGGVAFLRVPCGGSKARGVTGLPSPTGDTFWVDYVAHEIGHQWGGNHSFNSIVCVGNRNGSTAYEPGGGTTIQAYAGICGSDNIQSNSDDYFHTISFEEIVDYSTTAQGNDCPVQSATGNSPPVVDAGASFTIPIDTPFEVCGSANDVDPLTYNWEQFNLGPAGAPNSPSGDAPIFRSFPSVTSPCRTFPQLSDLLNNTQTLGEILPSYARTLTFRLTARDNRAGGGGVDYDSVDIVVSDVGGPFEVTVPNTAVTWTGLTSETVSWNVNGTHLAPISCSQVDILLSTDGGNTFPTTLLAATANDGTENVTPPDVGTTEARVQVRCTGNIFFDISNTDFTIEMANEEIFADGFESGDTLMWQ